MIVLERRFGTYVGEAELVAVHGDLTKQTTDAIVCPANSYGHMRGGVAQAIRAAGGDGIEAAAEACAPVPIGKAVATTAGRLAAAAVYHAPTMVEPVESATEERVRAAVAATMRLARKQCIRSISFPGMGTGTGGMSYRQGAHLLVDTVVTELRVPGALRLVQLVAFAEPLYDELRTRLEVLSEGSGDVRSDRG